MMTHADLRGYLAAAKQLNVAKRLAVLTDRQLAAVAPMLGEELEDAVRICRGIPQRNQVGLRTHDCVCIFRA